MSYIGSNNNNIINIGTFNIHKSNGYMIHKSIVFF